MYIETLHSDLEQDFRPGYNENVGEEKLFSHKTSDWDSCQINNTLKRIQKNILYLYTYLILCS